MYILLISSVIFAHYLTKNSQRNQKYTLLFVVFLIILMQGFRDFSIGIDLKTYMYYFDNYKKVNLFNALSNNDTEKLYVLLNKTVQLFNGDFRVLLFFVSSIIFVPLYVIIKKESKLPFISLFLFIGLGFFTFSLSGLRQSIAIGITLFSFKLIKERKIKSFIILIIIASNFHLSAVFFLIAYPVYHFRLKKSMIPIVVVSILGVYLFRKPIFDFLYMYYDETYVPGDTNAYGFLLLLLFLWGFSMIWFYKSKDKHVMGLMNLLLVSVFIQLFATYSTVVMRFGYYFYIYLILLIPEIIFSMRDKQLRNVAEIIVFSFFGIYFLSGLEESILQIYPYKFYFQDYIRVLGVRYK